MPKEHFLSPLVKLTGGYPFYNFATGEKPYWLNLFERGIEFPALFYLDLKVCYLIGRGIILNEEKKIILESTFFQKEYLDKLLKNHLVVKTMLVDPNEELFDIIPLLSRLSNNYYHWTTESIARLALFQQSHPELFERFHILIAADAPSFVKDSLLYLFKLPSNKIISWGNNDRAKVSNCLLIGYPCIRNEATSMSYIYHPSIYKIIHALSLKNIESDNDTATYLIVSRANVHERKLKGEEKIISLFPDIPFQLVYTEKMNFTDQVKMFRNAKIIIAPHGAGLSNLVYVNNNPLVIEIFPSKRYIRDAVLFYQIAAAMNINYHLIVKESLNASLDMSMDDELLSQLKAIISS